MPGRSAPIEKSHENRRFFNGLSQPSQAGHRGCGPGWAEQGFRLGWAGPGFGLSWARRKKHRYGILELGNPDNRGTCETMRGNCRWEKKSMQHHYTNYKMLKILGSMFSPTKRHLRRILCRH